MVPNIKYYVVTISAIFLALAVGIFMGFMLDAQELLSTQREDIVKQLESRFDELSAQTEETNRQMAETSKKNQQLSGFSESTYPLLVKDSLLNRNIAVVQVNEDYSYADIRDSLEVAGARVNSITTVKANLKEDEEAIRKLHLEVKGIETETEILEVVTTEIVNALTVGSRSAFLDRLIEQGYLNLSGEYGIINDTVLIAGGTKKEDEQSKNIISKAIEKTKENGKTVVGIEKSEVANSHTEIYRNSRISSVDNTDDAIGQTSLVLVLRGLSGNYGTKDTASALHPELNNLSER